ncbi:MAG: hypothetical protein AB1Z29_18230, partial [Desulfobacterales bacterium]
TSIAERPSHTTGHAGHVSGDSAGLTDTDKTMCLLGSWRTKRYRHFSICCTVPVRIRSLTATTIYPDHSVGNRSGLRWGETSAYYSNAARFHRLLCPLLTSATR